VRPASRLRIGIDTGGTFTDVVAFDEVTGLVHSTKTPSTPADPAEGFMEGIRLVLEQSGSTVSDIASVSHGTTVATNALLSDEIDGLGFLTTEGFGDVLEIARQSVPDGYGNSYFWVKPARIVPVHLVREVPGRLDAMGREVRPLDTEAVAAAADWFKGRGVTAVGICFLHAYVDPVHEEVAARVLSDTYPECWVSISSQVLREYREYERSVTTLVDAFVKRTVVTYVQGIEERLRGLRPGPAPPFHVMKSNGGVASVRGVGRQPITTVLSGPAAGALGAAHLATAAGYDDILTLDGGGTSTDVTVVRRGRPVVTTEGTVGRHATKVPMIDVATVGTGGGSIAWISPEGGIKVGPRSAGASPGPMCYGQGGSQPTLTDAHLTLGRIPDHLLGGRIPLDAAAARQGLAVLGAALGMEPEEAAAGVVEIATWDQANAIRKVTVRKGLDVRHLALCTFGGSGPLGACRLMDVLGIRAVVVPRDPGNVSAYGLLTTDVRNDEVQTLARHHAELETAQVAAVYAQLEDSVRAGLAEEGFSAASQRIERSADLRYRGQAFEVRAEAPVGAVDDGFCEAVVESFHDAHEALYGYCYRDQPDHAVEWVNLRVTGIGPIRRPEMAPLAAGDGQPAEARSGVRRVHFEGGWTDTALFDRSRLRAGDVVEGPAVIEEFGSTVPVLPGFAARVDRLGNLVITPAPSPSTGLG